MEEQVLQEQGLFTPDEGEKFLHALEVLSITQTDMIELVRFGKYGVRPSDPDLTNISRIKADINLLCRALEDVKEIC